VALPGPKVEDSGPKLPTQSVVACRVSKQRNCTRKVFQQTRAIGFISGVLQTVIIQVVSLGPRHNLTHGRSLVTANAFMAIRGNIKKMKNTICSIVSER
jgi:hypothetical protein